MLFGAQKMGLSQDLLTHVTTVLPNSSTWQYAVFNDEPLTSPNFIYSFDVTVDSALTSISSPSGWSYVTDNASYVLWTSDLLASDIAPQASLSGFVLHANAETNLHDAFLDAFDHTTMDVGPGAILSVQAPVALPNGDIVPEPAFTAAIMTGGTLVWRLRRRRSACH